MIKNTLLALVAMLPLVAQAELPVVQNAFIAPTPPGAKVAAAFMTCLLYTSPSPRDGLLSRMPSSA